MVLGTNSLSYSPMGINRLLTNGAGYKQLEPVLLGELQNVVQPLNVDSHGQRYVGLAYRTQQCTEVDQPIYAMVQNNFLQVLEVQDIRIHVRTCKNKQVDISFLHNQNSDV